MAQRLRSGKVILYTGGGHGTSSSTPSWAAAVIAQSRSRDKA
jgi:hypothetical protein